MSEFIDFKESGILQTIVTDYLFDSEKVASFFQYKPTIDSIEQVVEKRKTFHTNRTLLVECLQHQYQPIAIGEKLKQNIRSLSEANTFTVTTAHQPNLLLGPLYVIHKIVSVIKLTQILNAKYPHLHLVPVYWMGSEDHDKEELAHITMFGKPVDWNTSQSGAFGSFTLADIGEVRQQVFEILGSSEAAAALQQLLETYYFNQPSIALASRHLLNVLFGSYGLIVVDGNDAVLKRSFSPVMKEELILQPSFHIVNETNTILHQTGYETQATVRDINLFYMSEGQRSRITLKNAIYQAGETTFTQEQILKELEAHPQRFSPNVILRPLYQSMILPDIVFAGGGAEIAYHLQLKKLFEHFNLHYPMLLLRDMAVYTDEAFHKKLEKLQLSVKDLFNPLQVLIDKQLHQRADAIINLIKEREQLKTFFEQLTTKALQSDKTLSSFVEAEYKKGLHSLDAIEEKLKRSEKRKAEETLQQLQRLRNQLLPNDTLHERRDNFLQHYLRYGNLYIETLVNSFNAFDTRLKVIHFD